MRSRAALEAARVDAAGTRLAARALSGRGVREGEGSHGMAGDSNTIYDAAGYR